MTAENGILVLNPTDDFESELANAQNGSYGGEELAHVVSPNIAKDLPTSQSSTISGGVSSRAVDGATRQSWYDNSCTHTMRETAPWWQVDLQSIMAISKVKVYSRSDCCSSRMAAFKVYAGSNDVWSLNVPCGEDYQSVEMGGSVEVECDGRRAQYVAVVIPGDNKVLNLCEVEVTREEIAEETDPPTPPPTPVVIPGPLQASVDAPITTPTPAIPPPTSPPTQLDPTPSPTSPPPPPL